MGFSKATRTRECIKLGRGGRSMGMCVALMLVAALGGCGHAISGQYLARYTNGVGWLQLVETDDHHLTGQLEILELGTDGTITTASYAITGAVNGSEVSLSLKSPIPLITAAVVSGTHDGDWLTLTGGFQRDMPATSVFARSSLVEYQKVTADLNAQAQKIKARVAAAEAKQKRIEHERAAIAELTETGQKMANFAQASNGILSKLTTVPGRYQAITAKMEQMLDREKSLAGNQNAFEARTQLVVNMGQGPIASDQLHLEVQNVDREVREKSETFGAKADAANAACHRQYAPVADEPMSPGSPAWVDACRAVLANEAAYRAGYRGMRATLDELEQLYRAEYSKQNQFLKTAQSLQ